MLPDVVAHADWSVDRRKRWACVARRRGERYRIEAVEPVGDAGTLLGMLAGGRGGLLGVDAPIGVPLSYARAAGIARFLPWLRELPADVFARWSEAAACPADVSLARPFYPRRPGGARRAHLVEGLGVASFDDLLRACDRSPPLARPAASLFWTMGANQAGKAALSLWAEVVRAPGVRVWPFDGPLAELLAHGGVTLAEAYPAAFGGHLGAAFGAGGSKRRQADRAARAPALADAARQLRVELTAPVRAQVDDGFGAGATGEDAYDAFVGVLGMVNVLRGHRRADPPAGLVGATTVEGWILGVG